MTFLFSDIEGSTEQLQRLGDRHDRETEPANPKETTTAVDEPRSETASPHGRFRCALTLLAILVGIPRFAEPVALAYTTPSRDINLENLGLRHISMTDPRWASALVGPDLKLGLKMADMGCASTAIAMIANYAGLFPKSVFRLPDWDPLDNSPLSVDDWLRTEGGYATLDGFCSICIEWASGVSSAFFDATLSSAGLVFHSHGTWPDGREIVDAKLERSRPLPSILVLRGIDPERPRQMHAVVIAGWDTARSSYLILDPAAPRGSHARPIDAVYGSRWDTLAYYLVDVDVVANEARGGLDFWGKSPIALSVFDPGGRRAGADSGSGAVVSEIPRASYTTQSWLPPARTIPPEEPAKLLEVGAPQDGRYSFLVTGTGDGPFTVAIRAHDASGALTLDEVVRGTISTGDVLKYEIIYSGSGTSSARRVGTFAPHARAGNDLNGLTDFPVSLDASTSFDVDGSIDSYSWVFGDGALGSGATTSHVYAQPGTYTVTLTVTDGAGSSDTDTAMISVVLSQRRPVADAKGPYIGWAGSPLSLDARASFDLNGDPLMARWSFGDGTPDETAPDINPVLHMYLQPGTYTATLVVNDGHEDSVPHATTVEVLPPREQITLVTPSCAGPGERVALLVDHQNLVPPDGWNFGFNPILPEPAIGSRFLFDHFPTGGGDGIRLNPAFLSVETTLFSNRLDYSSAFTYTIPSDLGPGRLLVTQGELNVGPQGTIDVPCPAPINQIPIADAGGPLYEGGVGEAVALDGSASFDPDGDPLTYRWFFGDGTTGIGASPQHVYELPGEYFVTLVVNDGKEDSSTGVGTRSFAWVTVGGLPPGDVPGTIIVEKYAVPAGTTTSFGFTAGGGLSPTSFALFDGVTRTFANVVPGSGYSLAESMPAGWELRSASCSDGSPISNISIDPGETVTCTFTNAVVFMPGGGSFVIGDKNAAIGTEVTFWGAQWWKLNSLSGGTAPAAFKGFAKNPSTPICGTNWSTDPGNSVPPPAGPLPTYIGVIVASSIGKSGSTITGNILDIVIVRTDAGYAPNPGHAGTGTVVATVCGASQSSGMELAGVAAGRSSTEAPVTGGTLTGTG